MSSVTMIRKDLGYKDVEDIVKSQIPDMIKRFNMLPSIIYVEQDLVIQSYVLFVRFES